ncbi:hypothetical protein HanHA89_Chr04g0131621 [Helianthus annuus]|nr:hypothetical protein HanHA89_Chr04g0131621 [Helianthus annuus]
MCVDRPGTKKNKGSPCCHQFAKLTRENRCLLVACSRISIMYPYPIKCKNVSRRGQA